MEAGACEAHCMSDAAPAAGRLVRDVMTGQMGFTALPEHRIRATRGLTVSDKMRPATPLTDTLAFHRYHGGLCSRLFVVVTACRRDDDFVFLTSLEIHHG